MRIFDHAAKPRRNWLKWLGVGFFGMLAFGAGFGSLALEHRLQKEFRSAAASIPAVEHGTPEFGLFPPRVDLDRLSVRGPHGVLSLKDIRLEVLPLESSVLIRGFAAGGSFEAVLQAEDWGRGACKVSWKAEDADLAELVGPWAALEHPVALLGGRVSMEGSYAVPGSRDMARPWMGSGRMECVLEGGSVRHALPVLTKMELDGVQGKAALDWNRKRVTLRGASLRQKEASLELSGGVNLVPGQWHRSALQLEAVVKAGAGLLNEKLLPPRAVQQAREGLRLRLHGTPEKPKLEF